MRTIDIRESDFWSDSRYHYPLAVIKLKNMNNE